MKDVLEKVVKNREEGKPSVLVMIVATDGHGPCKSGAKMAVWENGETYGTIGGGALENLATKRAEEVFKERKNVLEQFDLSSDKEEGQSAEASLIDTGMVCGGKASVYFEYIGVEQKIYIFGAGHIGKALAYHLWPMDYEINVFDSRKESLNEIGGNVNKFMVDYENDVKALEIRTDDMIVIVTHSHLFDYAILENIIERKLKNKYIGLVASPRKVEEYKTRLSHDLGWEVDLATLYSPAGLEIGGDTPHEIALSIAAQIQAVKNGKFSQCLDLL